MEINKCMGCMSEFGGYPCPKCGFDPGALSGNEYVLPMQTILAGKYLVGRVLGQGGFGITYIGWDIALERKVAIKEYYPSGQVSRAPGTRNLTWYTNENARAARQDGMRLFLREARKMAKLEDIAGVVKVRDLFQENETAYIVMDFVEGQTLKSILRQNGPMSWETAKGLFLPAIRAMERVHQAGLVHRDLSPDNLMITPEGGIKILDLGAAKDLNINSGASSVQVAKGGFSPFEQYTQRGGSGPWTDVYAMAATIYYTLTGKLPPLATDRVDDDTIRWDYPNLRALPSPTLEALRKAMTVQTKLRTQSMAELESGLLGTAPDQKPEPETLPKSPKCSLLWLIAAGAVVLVIAAASLSGRTEEKNLKAPEPIVLPTAVVQTTDTPAQSTEAFREEEAVPETTIPVETFSYLGGLYEGQTTGGQPSGMGRLTWESCVYYGNFSGGYPQGSGEVTFTANGASRTLRADSWAFSSGDFSFEVECGWMGKTLRETLGQYRGLTCTDDSGNRSLWGWGELTLDCGASYRGGFADGVPNGYGEYTYGDGSSVSGLWSWTTREKGVFDSDYPQSVTYYTGMTAGGQYAGFGAMAFDCCGVFYGEFRDGDVNGSGRYLYRLYNNQPEISGSNWGVTRSRKIDTGFKGSGLTLNGGLQGYGMSVSAQYGNYYIGEVENGYRGGYGRYFNPGGSERTDRRGLYVKGMFKKSA